VFLPQEVERAKTSCTQIDATREVWIDLVDIGVLAARA
jgi:hypothetical protein